MHTISKQKLMRVKKVIINEMENYVVRMVFISYISTRGMRNLQNEHARREQRMLFY